MDANLVQMDKWAAEARQMLAALRQHVQGAPDLMDRLDRAMIDGALADAAGALADAVERP